ncbi:MAG: hypothetical protein WCI59_14545 [Betaproteobacteria bacterium]|jgi:hypothetical protein
MTTTITLKGRTQEVHAEADTPLSAVGRQPVTSIEGLAGPVADAMRAVSHGQLGPVFTASATQRFG